MTELAALEQLDRVIGKSRTLFYKPIQIAECLHHHRIGGQTIDLAKVDDYRNASKAWRDAITRRLVGRRSISSAKFQDAIWGETEMPPDMLAVLGELNIRTEGWVEAAIYKEFAKRQSTVLHVLEMIRSQGRSLRIGELLDFFESNAGVRRSIDKAFEIVAHSALQISVEAVETTVVTRVDESKLGDVGEAVASVVARVVGLEDGTSIAQDARIYRVGVTNASDRGLDMWCNFGPAVQVKHRRLTTGLAREVVEQIESDDVVIVCIDVDATVHEAISSAEDWTVPIRAIVSRNELEALYECLLAGEYASRLLDLLRLSFEAEFPQTAVLEEFLDERGYLEFGDLEALKAAVG